MGASLSGQIPALENLPPHNEDGAGGGHVYTPWWLYQEQLAGKLGFARGYHIEFGSGREMPGMGTGSGLEHFTRGSYGRKFKEDARRYYGTYMGFSGRGEMIPNADSYCELDPVVKDKWGIPVLRFTWKWSEHETRQAEHMVKTFADIITTMGGKVLGAESHAPPRGQPRHREGRPHHPRGRRRDDRRRSAEIRHESLGPHLGREEPLPHRRRALRLQRRQETPPSPSWRWPGAPATTSSPR